MISTRGVVFSADEEGALRAHLELLRFGEASLEVHHGASSITVLWRPGSVPAGIMSAHFTPIEIRADAAANCLSVPEIAKAFGLPADLLTPPTPEKK